MYSTGWAYFLWLISGFGWLGLHRHYLGKHFTGLLWMFTGGLGTVGSIYDFLTLPMQVNNANIRKSILNGTIRKDTFGQNWRNVDDGKSRIVREKENVETIALKLAKGNKGIVSPSDLALAANISMDEAKKTLDAMVSKGHAELRVRQSGSLVYTIPDFMNNDELLVD